jgi:hypothetical protein
VHTDRVGTSYSRKGGNRDSEKHELVGVCNVRGLVAAPISNAERASGDCMPELLGSARESSEDE